MAEDGSPSLKRLRLSVPSSHADRPETAEQLELHSFGDVESQEWRETLQAESKEQVKEDAKLEAKLSGRMRLEDLDERIKNVLTGITSKDPREALVAFGQLLRCDDGGSLLRQYVLLSPKCTEIMSIWSSEPGKEHAVPLLQLLDELLKHPMGKADEFQHIEPNRQVLQVVRLRLDKVARLIISTKLKDIYAHLTSEERSRQCAALHLLASIVKRGNMLASELATTFDFTLNVLPNLARAPKSKKREAKQSSHKWSTRSAFIDFAMSFLEVCHAALLRWVLQIRPLYGGVLHKLTNDDEITIIHVLKVFQLKVLDASAMVPPGLQSAVFGDSALEQMATISSDVQCSEAAQVAHDTLLQLCTNVSHGICPEPSQLWGASPDKAGNFGGGQGRLVRLMVKLKATEVQNHRDLLLSIAAKRPMLVATYFDFFPYSLEPRNTNAWFAAAALISDIILVSKVVPPLEPLATQGLPPPTIDSPLPQAILRSALPRTLTRLVINRGLLHANMMVKHGCLRMLSEVLSAGQFYLCSINKARSTFQQKFDNRESRSDALMTKNEGGFDACVGMETLSFDNNSLYDLEPRICEELDTHHKWLAFERHFQNELRSVLPDPQVLFSLLSLKPSNSGDPSGIKGRKSSVGAGYDDEPILDMGRDDSLADGVHNLEEDLVTLTENGEAKLIDIWNADEVLVQSGELEDVRGFLNAKLLEVLATYQRIMPMAIVDSSFDVFKLLPEDPVSLTLSQQKSLLMLLLAASGDAFGQDAGRRSQVGFENVHSRNSYRYLKPILKFTLGLKIKWIKQQWQLLAHKAMFSCGAFESNSSEIGIWLQFLPLCDNVVLSFLCDAVETVGRNVDKYVETLVSIIHSTSKQENPFAVLHFGPLVVCILDKCLRVSASTSKNLKISQKTSVCIYVANALSQLLQSQVHSQVLSIVLNALLSSRLDGPSADITNFRSEWSPLQNLLLYARWHLKRDEKSRMNAGFFQLQTGCLAKVLKVCNGDTSSPEAKAVALSSCLQCASPQELAENFPRLMEIFFSVFKGRLQVLVGLFGAYPSLLSDVSKLWPELFKRALISASGLAHPMRGLDEKSSLPQGQRLPLSLHSIPDLSMKEDRLSTGVSDITSFAFSVFLLGLPFAVIFPALASSNEVELWGSPHLESILQVALSEVSPRLWLCTANLILNRVEDLWEIHCKKGLATKCQLQVCFSLLKSMVLPSEKHGWFSFLQTDTDANAELDIIAEFLQGVLTHPVMNVQFRAVEYTAASDCDEEKTKIDEFQVPQVVEQWFQKGACEISLLLGHTVVIFKELLQWASEPPKKDFPGAFQKDCQSLQRVVLLSCKPFLSEVCCAVKTAIAKQKQPCRIFPSIPIYLAFTFSSHIDINSLAELSCTLLFEELTEEVFNWGPLSCSIPCRIVGLYLATVTFNRVVSLLQRGSLQHIAMLQQSLLQNLYQKVLHVVLKTPSDMAFSCLLSGLEAHRNYDYLSSDEWAQTSSAAVPFSYVYTTPLELLTHLMTGINKTKAKIILHLIQSSQCYLAVFAEALSCNLGVASVPWLRLAPLVSGPLFAQPLHANAEYTLEDKILLLPSVNWLVNATMYQEQMTNFKALQQILSVYFMTVVEILKDWNIFGTGLDMAELSPFLESKEHYDNFIRLFGSTTSGQVVLMLKHCLASHLFSTLEKENFLSLMVEKNYPLFDLSVRHIDELSLEATLKLISIITAKSMLANFLLSDTHEANTGNIQSIANCSNASTGARDMEMEKMRSKTSEVVIVFISTLCALFEQKFSENTEDKDTVLEITGVQVCISKHKLSQALERNLLENLKSILKATANVQLEAQHMSALKKFTKFVLRYRFGESLPMQVLRLYAFRMVHVPDCCRWYAAYGLNLLVGHSQFASTLLSSGAHSRIDLVIRSYSSSKSLSSILSLLKTPSTLSAMSESMSDADSKVACGPKLELLKFLRLLYYLKRQAATFDISIEQTVDPSELLSLLLAAYGASLNQIDKENLLLMREMEAFEGAGFSGLVGMDYLWGEAALKWRQANIKVEYGSGATRFSDEDTSREVRKRCFKEELPLDPTRCALGVLFFPMRRNVSGTSPLFLNGYEEEEKQSDPESAESSLYDAAYDACFILPFALHSLSCGWMDANDFVLKGLLALALVSTASADEDMRKLGYEILAKFLTVLEEGSSFKGKPQIKLLLIFVKNSVLEPWQRMPSVAALFAAEASCILMTPSDVHYPIVNKILFRTACLDLETIPLFKPMFGSGSVYFRADRSWVLRLLAFSLRTSFDTHVYRRRFILEILMSFYGSPLGDRHTREWILQILYRASKLRSFVQYLVEHCGLLSWLATIVCSNGTAKTGEYLGGISTELACQALQIFENTLHWRSVKRWLISEGFEELSKMAMVLHYALVETSSFSEPAMLIEPYLRILGTAFQFSQARRKFQSHFNLSLADFFALIQFVEKERAFTNETLLIALRTILVCQPPACRSIQDSLFLWKMGTWSLSVGLRDFYDLPYSLENNGNANAVESSTNSKDLIATVFQWLTASLILGESHKAIMEGPPTAWTFFRGITRTDGCRSASQSDINKNLLRLLIHQQCLLGTAVTNASAVCAVLLLLPSIEGPCGTFIKDFKDFIEWPLQQLSSPYELEASWRWRPFQMMMRQSLFEYETCQFLFALFQQLLSIEESTELHNMVERLQLGLLSYVKRQETCHSAHVVPTSLDLWKHLQKVLQLADNDVQRTGKCGMKT